MSSSSMRWLHGAGMAGIAGVLVYLLAPVLAPFATAFFLAYIVYPLVLKFERWGLSRVLAVVAIFALFLCALFGLLFMLIPLAQKQIVSFIDKVPAYVQWFQVTAEPKLRAMMHEYAWQLDADAIKAQLLQHWQQIGGTLSGALMHLGRSGLNVIAWLANLVLLPVLIFYLLCDWEKLLARLRDLLPANIRSGAIELARTSDAVLASFMRGQFTVMLCLAALYSVGLSLIGLDLALPLGMLAGLVSFVPYLGFILGLLSSLLAAVLQFHDVWSLVWVTAVFMLGQLLESFYLTPRFVGQNVGLHPIAVIFAVMAGGQLFGFVGVLLALPVAAVLAAWLRHYEDSKG